MAYDFDTPLMKHTTLKKKCFSTETGAARRSSGYFYNYAVVFYKLFAKLVSIT